MRKKMRKHKTNDVILRTAVLAGILFLWNGSVSRADSTGTVIVDSAKIRKEASTASEVIGSSAYNTSVTIHDEVTDSSGTVWYQVYVDANTLGYVRSDLVSKAGDGESTDAPAGNGADASAAEAGNPEGGAQTAAETPLDAQYATISVASAKVRTAPSTNDEVVESLPQGRQLIVSGQSNGGDGKIWYYVTYTSDDGTEKSGFVRSDLITLGEMIPPPVEEPVEVPEVTEPVVPEQPAVSDYEIVYEQENKDDPNSAYAWYLYDYTKEDPEKQKVEDLLSSAHARSEQTEKNLKTIVRQRIVIIVMAVLAVALIVAVVILIFKLRDAYYEDDDEEEDDEDEEDDEEEEERPARVRRVAEPEKSVRRPEAARRTERARGEEPSRRPETGRRPEPSRRPETGRRPEASRRPASREAGYREEESDLSAKQPPKRKAKNFLLDDDDFEFEFLNMEDKDSRE